MTRRPNPRHAALAVGALACAASIALGVAPAGASPNGVLISQFRFRGPRGGNDEFIQVKNTSTAAADLSGYQVKACGNNGALLATPVATVPSGTALIPAGSSLLFVNVQDGTAISPGYNGPVAGEVAYTNGVVDRGGIQLVDGTGTVIDGVGSNANPSSPCVEGTGLALPVPPPVKQDASFARANNGNLDTDNNATDFNGPIAGAPQNSGGAVPAIVAEVGLATLLPLTAAAGLTVFVLRRRRTASTATAS